MIKAIIIDDELHCINRLKALLQHNFPDAVQLIACFQTMEDGGRFLKTTQPDLVFLDVQLNECTGFDLLQQLPEVHFDVIFTTAFEQYAVQAFKFSAIDYLLKPIELEDLKQAVQKLKVKLSKEERAKKLEALFFNLNSLQGTSKKISIPTVNGLEFLLISDIIRCESEINYTTIYLKGKQKITVAKTLKEFEELLAHYNFFRVHNSHLINLAYIKSYNKGKGGFVSMTDHSIIEVATRRKEEFLKRITAL